MDAWCHHVPSRATMCHYVGSTRQLTLAAERAVAVTGGRTRRSGRRRGSRPTHEGCSSAPGRRVLGVAGDGPGLQVRDLDTGVRAWQRPDGEAQPAAQDRYEAAIRDGE